MPGGKYSGFTNANFSVMLYRYAIVSKMLQFSEKLPDVGIFLGDDDIARCLDKEYSEQRERLLFLCADGIISKKAFDILFDADEDILDVLCGIEDKIMTEDCRDKGIYEKAAGIALFSKRYDILSAVGISAAMELSASDHIIVSFDEPFHISYSGRLTDVLLSLGVPLVMMNVRGELADFDADELIEKRRKTNALRFSENKSTYDEDEECGDRLEKIEADDDAVYLVNMNRLPFILQSMDRLYGVDFIKYSLSDPSFILRDKEETERRYNDYLNNRKLKFTINAYLRLRNLCTSKINIVDYRTNKIVDDHIVSSSLLPDEKLSVSEIRLTGIKSENKEAPGVDVLLKKALKEYIRPKGIIAKETVIEVLNDGNSYWYVYKDTGDNKFDFCPIERYGFLTPAFDYNEVFDFVQSESKKKHIGKINGRIDFTVDPDGHTPEFLDYARNVLADQYKRRSGSGSLAKMLSERLKAAADSARKPPGDPEDPVEL